MYYTHKRDEEVISSEQNYKKFLLYLDKKSIANFCFRKYNDLVVQLRISNKEFQKRKKESAFIMRKQTKLVAVLSASALLALGASMTSYAAGWTEENGTWVYYDNDGYAVTDEWRRSGNYWFWLNSDGEMATNELIEDDGDYYYVDSNGAMVTNRWIQLENEDMDDENDSEYVWYYFQNNGKAYTASEGDNVSFKTINGKKYTFDEEGQMLWGWIDESGERITDDADWANGMYYCGTADDGAQVTGWAQLHVVDDDVENRFDGSQDEEEQDYWFYFNTNGKKVVAQEDDGEYVTKTINGNKYAFDSDGVMAFEWNDGFATADSSDSKASAAGWQYYNDRTAGNRAKGWFYEIPSERLNSDDYDDGTYNWYYAKNDGTLYANEIKTINGKKYAFGSDGKMLSGLQALWIDEETGLIVDNKKIDEESEIDQYVDYNAGRYNPEADHSYEVYYFGSGDDGSMKLNTQNIDIDGEVYNFYFVKSGENKGIGFGTADVYEDYTLNDDLGIHCPTSRVYDDKAVYTNGLKVTADSDLRYQAVDVRTGEILTRSDVENTTGNDRQYLVLVNASGSIMKNKSSVKDGDDYYYATNKYGVIISIASERDGLDPDEGDTEAERANRYDFREFDC